MYNFSVSWDIKEQKVNVLSTTDINFPVTIVAKEYKSNATIWSAYLPNMSANLVYWMIPSLKTIWNFETMKYFTGITVCIYNTGTGELLYQQPFFEKFYNTPRISLSDFNFHYHNYIEFFIEKRYDRWLNKKYKLVVDAGANVGVFTECMLRVYGCENVVAIECNENLVKDLKKSYSNNSKVTIINKALHHTNENITFYQYDLKHGMSTTVSPEVINNNSNTPFSHTTTVSTITLQELVNTYKEIDLLKIDIEGGEYNIILNSPSSVFKHINNLLIECHFFNENHKHKENYYKLIKKLQLLGYLVEEFIPNQIDTNKISEHIFAYKPI